jgi:GTP-binding protein
VIVKTATFVKSSAKIEQLPAADLPEFAFIGRSNVGKSSLINFLVNKKELAHTSGSPGKTQTINHFLINKEWYLVDLPGYGFAKVAQTLRSEWEKTLYKYLGKRENLLTVFVLVDVRIEPQKKDLAFLKTIGEHGLAIAIVFTKADKISKTQLSNNIEAFRNAMLEDWEDTPPFFVTSVVEEKGKEELLQYIAETCMVFIKPKGSERLNF